MSEKLSKEIIDQLNDAWLNIDVKNSEIINPFEILRTDDPDEFHMKFTWLLMNPEYFCFICRHILNIDILPMQAMMLREMWSRKFPMLVGSRGLGKAEWLYNPVLTEFGWRTMGSLKVGDRVYSRSGKLCNITGVYPQGKKQLWNIKFYDGRTIDCCEDHLWTVKKGSSEKVLSTKEMYESGVVHRCNNNKYTFKYKVPLLEPIDYPEVDLPLDPYLLGCLLGNGSLTTATPKIATDDQFIVDEFRKRLPNFKIEKDVSCNNYTIVDKDTSYDYYKCSHKHRNSFTALLCENGLNVNCEQKFIPEVYKTASIEQRMDLVRGLLDTDGHCTKDGHIEFSNLSEGLVDDLIDVLRSLGIACIKSHENREGQTFKNPSGKECVRKKQFRIYINTAKPVFKLPRKLKNLKKTETGRGKYNAIIEITPTEIYDDMQCISVDSPDSTYITKDYIVTHNTFLLSVYCLLRALLIPNRKIVVVGSAFRQSRYLHDYMENIWKNAPILRDLCDDNSGPRRDVDMCKMTLNNSTVVALPIGDGCVNPYTLMTYEKSFGCMLDKNTKVWGNGKYRDIDYYHDNGVKPTKIVTTRCGYSYEGTHNHAMKVLRNSEIQWVRSDQMVVGDRILIDRSERWHSGDFKCTQDEAYTLGAMIGDGCWTNKYQLRFATKDLEIIDRVNSVFDNSFSRQKDDIHWNMYGINKVAAWVNFWQLNSQCYTNDKILPNTILSAPQDKMTACLQGLFDTDGHVFVSRSKGGTTISVNFTNTSKRLVEQIQYILLHYGIVSTVKNRNRNQKWNTVYELGIYGKNVKLFAEKIGFYLPRKRDTLLTAISERKQWNSFNDDIPVNSDVVEQSIDRNKAVPRKLCKSKILSKKSFQQQFLQEVLIYCNNPGWASLVDSNIYYDEIVSIKDSECHTHDIHVPEDNEYCANGFFSHNSKIRGQRANDIVADEFASMNLDIFENVIAGFAAVSASPAENVKRMAKEKMAKEKGIPIEKTYSDKTEIKTVGNQIILSGTAYYDFNHFASYWRRWKNIINTKGDPHRIKMDVFNGEEPPASFNWKDYSIIRIPVDLVPKGFMDEGQIARSKATIHNGIYLMEFSACFTKDSQGFFKRSLIESCVGTDQKPVKTPSGDVFFDPVLFGNKNSKYIMGVDPASEVDNFSIVILEVREDHRRLVYCWTTTRKDHTEKVKSGVVKENNFYSYCARKIRDLMKVFPIVHIAMDAQGGGISVSEALHDHSQLLADEMPIWPIIEEDKEKPSDDEKGLHILELCQFAKYEWYSEANHGLRKDLEDKNLIFPRFDSISIGLSLIDDKNNNRTHDTFEDCVMEIEELKSELSMIEVTQSINGRDRWDTPEIKAGHGKKKRLRKDRYSSLLMANMAARTLMRTPEPKTYLSYGGFAQGGGGSKNNLVEYIGPAWFTDSVKNIY